MKKDKHKAPFFTRIIVGFYIILLLLMCINSIYGVGISPNPADTEGYYTFDNTTDDSTPNEYNGTGVGITSVVGIINEAYLFNSPSDVINLPAALVPATADFTTSHWVKVNSGGTDNAILWTQYAGGQPGRALFRVLNSNTLSLDINGVITLTGSYPTDNQWHHVVVSRNGTSFKIYLDGSVLNSGTSSGSIYQINTKFGDGIPFGVTEDYTLDEMTVFNETLSQSEIDFLYQNGTPTTNQQYPFTPSLTVEIINITANGELFINNTIFTTKDIIFNVTGNITNSDIGNFTASNITTLLDQSNGNYTIQFEFCYNETCDTSINYSYIVNVTEGIFFDDIKVNGVTLTNNTYFNTTDLIFEVFLRNESTSGSINASYFANGYRPSKADFEGGNQFITNGLNGSINFTHNREFFDFPAQYILFSPVSVNGNPFINSYPVVFNKTGNNQSFPYGSDVTSLAYCNKFVGSDYAHLADDFPSSSSNAYFWNGTNFEFITGLSPYNYDLNILLCELFGGNSINNIYFYAQNNETSSTSINYTFTIDTIKPIINHNIPDEILSYNLTGININVTDTNPNICTIQWDEETPINCSLFIAKNFTTIGNHTYNITVTDLAGNIKTELGVLLVNPPILVTFYDFLNATDVSNYSVNIYHPSGEITFQNDINGTIFISPFYNNVLDLGNYTIEFIKTGYIQRNFTQLLNETNAGINVSFNVNPSFLVFNIKSINNGSLVNPGNYTIVINNEQDLTSQTINIVNNNTLTLQNIYTESTELKINLLTNISALANFQLIIPRRNITIDFYVTEDIQRPQDFEILSSAFLPVKFSITSFYVYIDGLGFVLQSEKKTNDVGIVSFNVVPFNNLYTVCNTYQGETKCLNQITFSLDDDTLRIIHSQTLTGETENVLDFITWSYIENKTLNQSEISFIFDDQQSVVDSFCLNVSRFENNSLNHIGIFCLNESSGIIVQTFSLLQGQYLEYTFLFYDKGIKTTLNKIRSYFDNVDIEQLKLLSIFDLIFLVIYFGGIGLLLGFRNLEYYNIGVLVMLLVIYVVQAVLTLDYIHVGVWGFMFGQKAYFYVVREVL